MFRTDVKDNLYEVIEGKDKFLIKWLYNGSTTFNEKNIILFDGGSSTYYLVTVRVVDSTTQDVEDRERGYAELLDKIGETALIDYLEDLNIEITDPTLKDYFNKLIGR